MWRERIASAGIIAGALAVGLVCQLMLPSDRPTVLIEAGSVGLALLILGATRFGKLQEIMGSFRFAAVLLSVLAVAVILGTLVPQEKSFEVYQQKYGAAAGFLQTVGITSLFHSSWFIVLLGVMTAAVIISAALRFPPNAKNLGFFLCHLGLIAILGGSAASFTLAVRGRIDLRIGNAAAREVAVTRAGVRTGERADLGFGLKLDGFKVDHWGAEHRLAVYALDAAGDAKQLATFDPDVGVTHRLPDRATYQVVSVPPAAAAPIHEISENGGPAREIAVGDEIALADGVRLRAVAFYPNFYFDLSTRAGKSADDTPANPALEVEITAPGQAPVTQYLLERAPGAAHGGGRAGLAYSYTAPAGKAAGDTAVVVEVSDREGTREVRLDAARRDAVFFGDRKVLTYERRPEEAKSFVSSLTAVVDGRPQALTVAVNRPVTVAGWSLYQANFDPRDPSYSGLEAVRDPGIPFVFAGFVLVTFGVPYMVNVAPWLRRRQQQTPAAKGGRR